jgi:hypothetical protein
VQDETSFATRLYFSLQLGKTRIWSSSAWLVPIVMGQRNI